MVKGLSQYRLANLLILGIAGGTLLATAQSPTREELPCTCGPGRSLETGLVSYDQNGRRETITRVEAETSRPGRRCRALWIGSTEIRPVGDLYNFYLERTPLKERRIYGCEYATERFVQRSKTYEFVFNTDSVSIREMRLVRPSDALQLPQADPQSKSNSNLWNSITMDSPADIAVNRKPVSAIDPTREFNRTSWVLARREIEGKYVGLLKDAFQGETLVRLNKTRKLRAGQLGQIEAVTGDRAIVRFYEGARIRKFGKLRNAIRRWYDRVGGPYTETKDSLYTAFGACILEVALDDIVEVNDYLDQQQADRT